jgi:hypothetical protein
VLSVCSWLFLFVFMRQVTCTGDLCLTASSHGQEEEPPGPLAPRLQPRAPHPGAHASTFQGTQCSSTVRAHAAAKQHAPASPRPQGPLGDITNHVGLRIVQLRPPPPLKAKHKLLKKTSQDIRPFFMPAPSG